MLVLRRLAQCVQIDSAAMSPRAKGAGRNGGDRREANGVFRGGGVKGLGLAGALLGFAEHSEKPVTKWVNVAGASAGAIIPC